MARGGWAGWRGFTLVEVVLALAVVSILAGMMAPLALKAVNQQKEAATRRSLQLIFETMFGARDRRVANMRADFAFGPTRTLDSLEVLVRRGAWGEVPAYGPQPGVHFPWGWNGPYWLGDLKGGVPVDAWGSPFQLLVEKGPEPGQRTLQLRSCGPSKRVARNTGELLYPPVPVPLSIFRASVVVTLVRKPEDERACRIAVAYGGNWHATAGHTESMNIGVLERETTASISFPAGSAELEVEVAGAAYRNLPLELLPGEIRQLRVEL